MKDTGYPKIVQILVGELIPVGSCHRDMIRTCAKYIFQQLNTTEILPHLYSKGVISGDDRQQIQRTEMTESTGIAALELLDLLPNRSEQWFRHFVDSLSESGHDDLAKLLVTKTMNTLNVADSDEKILDKQQIAQPTDFKTMNADSVLTKRSKLGLMTELETGYLSDTEVETELDMIRAPNADYRNNDIKKKINKMTKKSNNKSKQKQNQTKTVTEHRKIKIGLMTEIRKIETGLMPTEIKNKSKKQHKGPLYGGKTPNMRFISASEEYDMPDNRTVFYGIPSCVPNRNAVSYHEQWL